MSKPQVVEVYRDGKHKRIAVEEVECGHFLDSRVAESAREAIAAARDAGLFVSIIMAWRQHGPHQDGRLLELHLGNPEGHDEFVALAAAYGVHLLDSSRPGVFTVADRDKTPVEAKP